MASSRPINVLLQTTIEPVENDWHVGRFSMLQTYLSSLTSDDGTPLFNVSARNRDPVGLPDSVLSVLDESTFDQLWCSQSTRAMGLSTRTAPAA